MRIIAGVTRRPPRIGPRMREACRILSARGGSSPSIHAVAVAIGYGPGGFYSSPRYGHAVVRRCIRAGLMARIGGDYSDPGIRIRLTDEGYTATGGE